jgi:hypothetical protein
MIKNIKLMLLCTLIVSQSQAFTQSNILENGGFEAHWGNGLYPRSWENLLTNCPYPWLDFNPDGDEHWFTDSIFPQTPNVADPNYQHGYYYPSSNNNNEPWTGGGAYVGSSLMNAHSGTCFLGVDLESDWFVREGIQTKIQQCPLNSGAYYTELWFARGYNSSTIEFHLALSDNSSSRKKIFANKSVGISATPAGSWYHYSKFFNLAMGDSDTKDLTWFSITGNTSISSQYREYMYFDDVQLYRPCDVTNECYTGHGQICPEVFTPSAPNSLLRARNISNATKVELWLHATNGSLVYHVNHENRNGMPDFTLSRLALPAGIATAFYEYKLQISNDCGGLEYAGSIHVQDTALYNLNPVWVDTAANWTQTPIPCCLSNLTLQNTQIVGDVSFIVRDQITVQNGVSVAAGSHVTLQAGQVIELTNVEFDGTNSTVDIIELPCPNRLACDGSGGGTSVIDNGVAQVLPQEQGEAAPVSNGMPQMVTKEMIEETKQVHESAISAYPNPFLDQFKAVVTLEADAKVNLSVLDIQMRHVQDVFVDAELKAGEYEYSVDLKSHPAGIYFLRMEANGMLFHQKLVKQ